MAGEKGNFKSTDQAAEKSLNQRSANKLSSAEDA